MALSGPYVPPARIERRSRRLSILGGGTDGNEQLTAVTAVILLVLLAILGITIAFIGQLLWLHLFLGVLLIGPVLVKLASTGYRFVRYYTANSAYTLKGPPHPVMRILGPFVILTTLGVFFTGLLLLVEGPYASSTIRFLHKATFILWLGAMGLHVIGHLAELPRGLRAVSHAEGRTRRLPGSTGRALVLIASLVGGVVLALLFLPDVHTWTSVGLHPFRYGGDR